MPRRKQIPLRHIVAVLPGIGGSVLADAGARIVWGGGLARFVSNLLVPGRLSLTESPRLQPVGLLSVASELPGLATIHPYDALLSGLENAFSNAVVDSGDPRRMVATANIVAFPYDFRRSIVEAAERFGAEIDQRRVALGGSGAGLRVIVVAHSMGGLVARYWLGPLDGWRVCDALVTLGTPHRGAPKAVDWLVNGARLKGLRLDTATDVIRTWPSVFELLPRYQACAIVEDGDSKPCYPYELPIDVFGQAAIDAFKVHQDIETASDAITHQPTSGDGLRFRAIYGHSHKTMQALVFDGVQLTARVESPRWLPDLGLAGDGTVPQLSAIPIDLDDDQDRWDAASERHGALALTDGVVEFVKSVTGPSIRDVRTLGAGKEQLIIGADMTGSVAAPDGMEVDVEVDGFDDDIDVSAWQVSLRPVGNDGTDVRVRVVASGARATITSGPLAPGLYRFDARVTLGIDHEPPPLHEFVFAVEP